MLKIAMFPCMYFRKEICIILILYAIFRLSVDHILYLVILKDTGGKAIKHKYLKFYLYNKYLWNILVLTSL